jgi:hypothetical protein
MQLGLGGSTFGSQQLHSTRPDGSLCPLAPTPPVLPAVYSGAEFARGKGWIKKSKPAVRPGAPRQRQLAGGVACAPACLLALAFIYLRVSLRLLPCPLALLQRPPRQTRRSGCAALRQTPSCARSSKGLAGIGSSSPQRHCCFLTWSAAQLAVSTWREGRVSGRCTCCPSRLMRMQAAT